MTGLLPTPKYRVGNCKICDKITYPPPYVAIFCLPILHINRRNQNPESWILSPWIQEFFLGSWILNLGPFAQDFSATLGSWIFNLGKNAFWMHSLQNPQKIELKAKRTNKNIGSFKVKMHIHPMLETLIIPIKMSQN